MLDFADVQISIATLYATLLTAGIKQRCRHTRWHAGVAKTAVRSVQMGAAAPKTNLGKFGVNVNVDGGIWVNKQRSRLFVVKVTALVRVRRKNFKLG